MDGAGKIDATVMGLKIVGSGGMGVRVQNETGTMTLMGVEIEGFKMGVNAQSGTVKINGESTITVEANGTGIMVSGSGATVKMMEGTVTFEGAGHGVKASGEATADLTKVTITGEGSGKGVWMDGKTLEITNVDVLNVFVGQNRKSNRKIVTFIRLRKRGCTILVIIKCSLL
ncbi:hypothetical protein BBbe_10520 [Bartonella bovis 91-4]|uniref:Right handed beta helix domain-containing protein n=2 Tax=Bartonella bovis TaxID=155194 RepID=N6UJV0_9HYPH|nr:hypothetical protein [Bartonella bovis]ENN90498.1 hypothetical protein BBbe_10520 [Bartonella bovis 91-4]